MFSVNINITFFWKSEYSENVYKLIENASEKIDPNLSVKLQQLEDKKNEIYLRAYENAKNLK